MMTWENFYFLCFLVGFALSLISFVVGSLDLHLPDMHVHAEVGHLPHIHVDAGHAAGMNGANGSGGHAAPSHGLNTEPELSWINFGTVTAFLAWFGGTGYLLTRFSGMWLVVIFLLSSLSGILGASIMFWFVAKFLMKHDKALDPLDYDMVGVLGSLSVSIREGGTGEIVFVQEGVRHSVGARSETGNAITRGTEVVVTRYDKGIAYVRRWDELADSQNSSAQAGTEQ